MNKSTKLESERLAELQKRKSDLLDQIAAEKKRLEDQSRKRMSLRHLIVGEVVFKMVEEGQIPEDVVRSIKMDLLTRVEGKNREFQAFQGSVFELNELLLEMSEPVD